MNDAVRKRLLQLLKSLVGDERVIQIQLLADPFKRGDVGDTGVGQLNGVEQELVSFVSPDRWRDPRRRPSCSQD